MASEFDDLIKEFGSGNKGSSKVIATPYDDLIKQFGSGNVQTAAPAAMDDGPVIPSPDRKNIGVEGQRQSMFNREVEAIKKAPSMWVDKLSKDAGEGKATVGEGINDIAQNRPLSGLGKVALGGIQWAASPATATLDTFVKQPVTGITGNERLGDVAEFAAGGGLPVVRMGKALNAVRPSNKAYKLLIEAVGDDAKLAEGLKRLKENDRLSVVDVFPAVKQDAQKLVTIEGKHQTPLIEAIEKRQAGSRGAVEAAYDDVMGAPVDVVQKLEQLKQRARDTGSTIINPIVEKRGAIDVTQVVKNIDSGIGDGPVERAALRKLKAGESPDKVLSPEQQALWSLREKIRGIWSDKDQMFLDMKGQQGLHTIQMNLRAEAQALLDSDNPLQRKLGQKLMNVRNDLVEAGGKEYKAALNKYADDMQIQEGFQYGQNILRNRPTHIEDRPESLRKKLTDPNTKPDEIEAIRDGARVAVDNQIRSMRFAARRGADIPEVDFNKQKLEMLFGKDEVDSLARKLRDEKDIAQSTSDLVRNSQTAMRLRSNARVDLPVDKGTGLGPFLAPVAEAAVVSATGVPGASIPILAGQLGSKGVFKVKDKLARKTNEEYSRLLMPEGEARLELIQNLENYLKSKSNPSGIPYRIQSITNKLSGVIGP